MLELAIPLVFTIGLAAGAFVVRVRFPRIKVREVAIYTTREPSDADLHDRLVSKLRDCFDTYSERKAGGEPAFTFLDRPLHLYGIECYLVRGRRGDEKEKSSGNGESNREESESPPQRRLGAVGS